MHPVGGRDCDAIERAGRPPVDCESVTLRDEISTLFGSPWSRVIAGARARVFPRFIDADLDGRVCDWLGWINGWRGRWIRRSRSRDRRLLEYISPLGDGVDVLTSLSCRAAAARRMFP